MDVLPVMTVPACNSCGGVLYGPIPNKQMTAEVDEVWFDCLECDQQIGVAPSGRSWQIILPMLWPSEMPPRMHHQAAEQNGREKVFGSELMVVAGFRTKEEHVLYVAEVTDAVERYKNEHPVPGSLRERLKGVFS